MFDDETKLVAVFGNPVRPTPTPRVYNQLFEKLQMNLVCVAFEPTTAEAAAEACGGLDLAGAAFTLPFKEAIVTLADEVDEGVRSIDAANTIVVRSRRLVAYNTDWIGFLHAVTPQALASSVCVVLGAGGAARAAAFAALSANAEVHLLNRTAERAERVANDFGLQRKCYSLAELDQIDYDILVNATSVGMYDGRTSIVPQSSIRPDSTVVDFVFEPTRTELLRQASVLGCRTVDGISILAEQAAAQIRLCGGSEIKASDLEETFRSR